MPASAITRPEPAMVTDGGQLLAAVGAGGSQRKQPSSSARIVGRDLADRAAGVARGGLAHQRDGAVGLALPDEVHFRWRIGRAAFRPPAAVS